jgi:hypothetical protein
MADGFEEGHRVRALRRLVVLAVIAGLAIKVLRTFGILDGGECSPACACSQGEMECTCGHRTCLSPAVA